MDTRQHDAGEQAPEPPVKQRAFVRWLKRIGIAGFLFFLLKGLAWLFFGAALVRYFGCRE
jgi:hypothetical protein